MRVATLIFVRFLPPRQELLDVAIQLLLECTYHSCNSRSSSKGKVWSNGKSLVRYENIAREEADKVLNSVLVLQNPLSYEI